MPLRPPIRAALLEVLADMPDEAFAHLVIQISRGIWPSGLGGFMSASRKSIEAARAAANKILEGEGLK